MKHPVTICLLLTVAACATTKTLPEVAAPLVKSGSAYEVAATVELPSTPPAELAGLHNVYHLSGDIVSGGEPEGEEAMRELAAMGIATILSVDGKVPDAELAARYGMRYVHVPIRYSEITEEERLEIAKTFRELPGPFYVHCFHGQHRGPAAAALGRIVLDGCSRAQALAEMRQWCGTSPKYEGLYSTIAFDHIPTAAETAGFAFDFPAAHEFRGFRQAMVEISRSWDVIDLLSKRGWKPEDSHPDASARNEAARMVDAFVAAAASERATQELDDFRGWLADSERLSRELADALRQHEQGDQQAGELARTTAAALKQICSACHKAYRD
ncbi:MAG: hypothetical protein IPM29_25375 [Planctomycetes bacterium]|nr:hypothetical protein [Planctomycetota bacterium]